MNYLPTQKFAKQILFLAVTMIFFGCSSDDDVPGPGPVDPVTGREAPVAVDDNVTTAENTQLTIEGLLDNDTVYEYARISAFDTSTEAGGSVEDNRDGTYTYTPPQNYTGDDSFEYTICDNLSTPQCSSATVNITITGASPTAVDDSYQTSEGEDITIRNFLANDDLLDNATLSSVDTEGSNGSVVISEDGNLTYTPSEGFAGEDTFTYTICDDDETPECSTATITIMVTDEGSPIASDDLVVVDANKTEITLNGLLDNDELIDDAVLTSIDASASQGTVVLNEDGTITYSPLAGFTGEDTFTYSICDDDSPEPTCASAIVTVRVIDPVAFNIPSEYADYYEDVVFSQDQEVNYHVLSELTREKHTTILSYGQRHEYLYDADEDLSNPENVILMYTGESRYWKEYWSDSNSYSPQTFNTEHIYPQSRLTAADAVTDLHHLRVADADVNSTRLNHPFTEGSGEAGLVGEGAWYPGDEWKGDVARMIFYLNIRYGETFNKVGNLELFLKWNAEDPVSAFEMQRQEVIYGAQGNRNPFIDNPYLATLTWGGEDAENTWE